MNSKKLPLEIKVKIKKEESGIIFAELCDYGIFTEANSFNELIFNVNDLVCSFFDISSKDRYKFWYLPSEEKLQLKQKENISNNPLMFYILTRPDLNTILHE